MYAKLIEGVLRIAPNKVEYEDVIIYNPPDAVYEELGYYPLQYTDEPQDAPTGYHYEDHWEQGEDAIIQVWELVEDPEDIDEYEAFDIIFGGAE